MRSAKGIEIESVTEGSLSERTGFMAGDTLLSIDGKGIRDIIDVAFYSADMPSQAKIKRGNQRLILTLSENEEGQKEGTDAFAGITFKPFRIKTCTNNCIFCFVSQLPKGLRKTLYVKDEDYRMSFLYGSYITLTNLSAEDKKRIIEQSLSPLYISVHATDRDKRNILLGNAEASSITDEIRYLARHKIRMHTQIVVCPGYNDGTVLEKTITDLYRLHPYVMSIAVVPVGITTHRKRQIQPFDQSKAVETIKIIERLQNRFRKKHGEGIVYGADELYLKANRTFPDLKFYDELPQIENGVGMTPLFIHQSKRLRLKRIFTEDTVIKDLPISVFTGASFFPFLKKFAAYLQGYGVNIDAFEVINSFFGSAVTVAGLLTGRDIIKTLSEKVKEGSVLLIPSVMLREGEGVFLDDVSTADIDSMLHVKTMVIPSTVDGIVEGIMKAYKGHYKANQP